MLSVNFFQLIMLNVEWDVSFTISPRHIPSSFPSIFNVYRMLLYSTGVYLLFITIHQIMTADNTI